MGRNERGKDTRRRAPSRAERKRDRIHRPRAAAPPRAAPPPPPEADPLAASAAAPGPETLRRRLARFYGLDDARRYGGVIWVLAAGTIASYIGRGAAMPFVFIYLNEHAGITLVLAGLGVLTEQVTRALLSPLFGGMSDRWGRKPFMVAGLILQAVTITSYLLVRDPVTYIVVSVLAGFGQAPYQPALSAFLAEIAPPGQRVGAFGLVHMTKNLGYFLGVGVGGLLVTQSFAVLFLTGGVLPLVYALIVLLFIQEPERAARPHRLHPLRAASAAVRDARFVGFLAAATAIFVSWGQMDNVLPFFIQAGLGLDSTWISRVFLLNGLLVVLFQVPVSSRVERWSRPRGIAAASAITAVAFLVLAGVAAVAPSEPDAARAGLLLAAVVITLAEMIDTPLLFALAADLAPPDMMGGAMGVLALAAPLGMAAAPVLAGLVGSAAGWTGSWLALSAVLLLGAVAFLAVGAALRPRPTEIPVAAPALTH